MIRRTTSLEAGGPHAPAPAAMPRGGKGEPEETFWSIAETRPPGVRPLLARRKLTTNARTATTDTSESCGFLSKVTH